MTNNLIIDFSYKPHMKIVREAVCDEQRIFMAGAVGADTFVPTYIEKKIIDERDWKFKRLCEMEAAGFIKRVGFESSDPDVITWSII